MVYAILMAVAFIGAASLITILIVTKKKEESEDSADLYEAVYTPSASSREGKSDTPKADRREMIFTSQQPGKEDFGTSEFNPICTASVLSSEKYLAMLRTDAGEPVQWIREGTISVRNLHGVGEVNEEVYTIYLHGERYRQLYLCPYGKNSTHVPVGFSLTSDGEPAPYGGSVLAEAQQKGITEEQVLAKQALIYENSSPRKKPAARAEQVRETSLREEKGSHEKKASSAPVEEKKPKEEEKASSASFPNYLPGFEPENVKPALDRFLAVMEKEFPDKKIPGSAWNHEKWDKAAAMLCKVLGYGSGSEFLEAYGFTVMKDA